MTQTYPKSGYLIRPIILMNVLVYLAWTLNTGEEADFMARNFLVSWAGLTEGRYWILLTSAFSHNLVWHILLNMMVLNSFGPIVEMVVGARSFLFFYLGAGVFSSLCHAALSNWMMNDPGIPALGASGAISGVILLFSLLFPREKILIFGLIPMPALIGALAFIGLDVWGLIEQSSGSGLPIGHGAHLGGAAVGIFYYFFVIRARLKKNSRL